MEAEVDAEIEEAVAFARSGTLEPVSEMTRFVYRDDAQNARLAVIAPIGDAE
jgi:hypothetical protein